MGCYNGTCGISQLPITEGEDVVLFILKKNKDINGFGICYSDDAYMPIDIQIFSQYDDYGFICDLEKNDINDCILEILNRRFKKEGVDCEINYKNFKETIINLDEKKFGFMIVHRSMYEKIMQNMKERTNYKKEKIFHKIKNNIEVAIKLAKRVKKAESIYNYKQDKKYSRDEISRIVTIKFTAKDKLQKIMRNLDNCFIYNDFFEDFIEMYEKCEKSEILLNELINFIIFGISMSYVRKAWLPQAGCGSQINEMFLHKIIANEVIKKEQEYREKLQQYDDYNEEEIEKCTEEDVFIF